MKTKLTLKRWSPAEINILKTNTSKRCQSLLPDRTTTAITAKRCELGITNKGIKRSPAEKAWDTRRKNEPKTYADLEALKRKVSVDNKNLKFVINGVNLELSSTAKNVVIGTNLIKIDF